VNRRTSVAESGHAERVLAVSIDATAGLALPANAIILDRISSYAESRHSIVNAEVRCHAHLLRRLNVSIVEASVSEYLKPHFHLDSRSLESEKYDWLSQVFSGSKFDLLEEVGERSVESVEGALGAGRS
jgi:hypothetical protein